MTKKARSLLATHGILRLRDFMDIGVTAATVGRMENDGEVVRLARGLYQLPEAELDANHGLAEAAKRFLNCAICLVCALAFHEITDQLPRNIWIAIGRNDWTPKLRDMQIRTLRFSAQLFSESVEAHALEGVSVKVFGVAKTVAAVPIRIALRAPGRIRPGLVSGCGLWKKEQCPRERWKSTRAASQEMPPLSATLLEKIMIIEYSSSQVRRFRLGAG